MNRKAALQKTERPDLYIPLQRNDDFLVVDHAKNRFKVAENGFEGFDFNGKRNAEISISADDDIRFFTDGGHGLIIYSGIQAHVLHFYFTSVRIMDYRFCAQNQAGSPA